MIWYPITVDGVELIINGTFDDSVAWSSGTAWTIAAGKARCVLNVDPLENTLNQATPFVDGEDYDIHFDVTEWNFASTGELECHVNDPSSFPQVATGIGHYEWTVTAGPGLLVPGLTFDFLDDWQAGDIVSIDNVEIYFPDSEMFVDLSFGDIAGTKYRAYDRDAGGFVQHYVNRLDRIDVMFRME